MTITTINPSPGEPGTDLVRHGDSLNVMGALWELAQRVHRTPFCRKFASAEDAFAAFMRGHELGLEPFQSAESIDVIQGTPTLKPEVMRALIRQHGHDYDIVEQSAERCVIKAHRREWDAERWSTHTFTIDDARAMQLTGKDNWKKQPRVMLLARCTSAMARADFPDVIRGLSYTPEEIESFDTTSTIRAPWAIDDAASVEPPEPNKATEIATPEADRRQEMRSMFARLEPMDRDALKSWWKEKGLPTGKSWPAGTLDALPPEHIDAVLAAMASLLDGNYPDDDDHDPAPAAAPVPNGEPFGDDSVVDAELVDTPDAVPVAMDGPKTKGGTALGRDAERPPGRDGACNWHDVLKAQFRELGLSPPQRTKLAAKCLGHPVRSIADLDQTEAQALSEFLDSGELAAEAQAVGQVVGAFPGAEEIGA